MNRYIGLFLAIVFLAFAASGCCKANLEFDPIKHSEWMKLKTGNIKREVRDVFDHIWSYLIEQGFQIESIDPAAGVIATAPKYSEELTRLLTEKEYIECGEIYIRLVLTVRAIPDEKTQIFLNIEGTYGKKKEPFVVPAQFYDYMFAEFGKSMNATFAPIAPKLRNRNEKPGVENFLELNK